MNIECDDSSIHLRPVVIDELSNEDYKKLAAKLDQLKKESGTSCNGSDSARDHLKRLMK